MLTTDNLDSALDSSQANATAAVTETGHVDPVDSLKQFLKIAQDGGKTDLTSLSAPDTSGIYAANENPRTIQAADGQQGDLTITPAFAPNHNQTNQDRHVGPGRWDLLEIKKPSGPGALHFDTVPVQSKPDLDSLELRFNEENKDGKLSADPVWQKYLASLLPAKTNSDEWQAFLRDQVSKHSDDHLLPKLLEAKNDSALSKQLDDLQHQLEQSPEWKQFLQATEVEKLKSGQSDAGLHKYLDAHPEVSKALEGQKAEQEKQVEAEHKRLSDWADKNLKEPERSDFKKDMTEFEDRAKRDGLTPEDIIKTYKQIDRLAEATGNKPLPAQERQHLAQQVMHQVAVPTSISQGQYRTCNVTSVESRTYTRTPADAARLVADVALTGQYRAGDGSVVRINPIGHGQSKVWPTIDGQRTHASEIFEVTAINLHYAKFNRTWGSLVRYEQREPSKGDNGDNGERLIDYLSTPPEEMKSYGKPLRAPNLSLADIADLTNQITGRNEKDILLTAVEKTSGGVTHVGSQAELEAKLKELKTNHQLPVIVWVDTQNEPFYTDSGAGAAGGSGGSHVVTITDYDEKTGMVCIDNQWDKATDHGTDNPVKVKDLFIAMHTSEEAEKLLALEVQTNREKGIADPAKEFDLLRHKIQNKHMTPEEVESETQRLIAEESKRFSKTNPTEAEKDNEWMAFAALIQTLDASAQIRLVRAAHAGALIDDRLYEQDLQVLLGSIHRDRNDSRSASSGDMIYNRRRQEIERAMADLPPEERKKLLETLEELDRNDATPELTFH